MNWYNIRFIMMSGLIIFLNTPIFATNVSSKQMIRLQSKKIVIEELSLYKLLLIMQQNINRLLQEYWVRDSDDITLRKRLEDGKTCTTAAIRLLNQIADDFNRGAFYVKREIAITFVNVCDVLDFEDSLSVRPGHIRNQCKKLDEFYHSLALHCMNRKEYLDPLDNELFDKITKFVVIIKFGLMSDDYCKEYFGIDLFDIVMDYMIYQPIEFIREHKILTGLVATVGIGTVAYYLYNKKPQNNIIMPPGARGLRNRGNTCYMNSALQCMMQLETLNTQLKEVLAQEGKRADPLISAYVSLTAEHQGTAGVSIDPEKFVNLVWGDEDNKNLEPFKQHDSQEFLAYFFNHIPDGIKKNVFSIDMESRVYCAGCNKSEPGKYSKKQDEYFYLQVEVNDKTLDACLHSFLKAEDLTKNPQGRDERYNCAECGGKRDATRQLVWKKAPNVLVLQLKRFEAEFDKDGECVIKRKNNIVSFPLKNFNVDTYCQETGKNYNLTGIVMHASLKSSAESGHYTAYTKNLKDNKWYFCNDSRVKEVSEQEVLHVCNSSSEPYLLFYQLQKP